MRRDGATCGPQEKNGVITEEEMRHALKTIGLELSENQFQEMLAAADTDGRSVSLLGRGLSGASVVVRPRVIVVADRARSPPSTPLPVTSQPRAAKAGRSLKR